MTVVTRVKVYVVCEYGHEPADEVHKIVLVTGDKAAAQKKVGDGVTYFYEEHWIDAVSA